MAEKTYTSTVASTIESAFSEIEELASEVREVVDNASGTPRENTSRIQTLDATASALEALSAPDTPDEEHDLPVVYTVDEHRRMSRSDRRYRIIAMLEACAEVLGARENVPEEDPWDGVQDKIEEASSELENVEFPGMYG